MPQSEFVVLSIVVAFLIFVTARGELSEYIRLLI
jgi:hypothetical protein